MHEACTTRAQRDTTRRSAARSQLLVVGETPYVLLIFVVEVLGSLKGCLNRQTRTGGQFDDVARSPPVPVLWSLSFWHGRVSIPCHLLPPPPARFAPAPRFVRARALRRLCLIDVTFALDSVPILLLTAGVADADLAAFCLAPGGTLDSG